MPTIPDLDKETKMLNSDEAVDLLPNLPQDSALYVISFQSGHGEYYDFIRRVAPIVAEPKPFQHFRGTSGGITRYPLDSVVSILMDEDTRDIVLVPLDRMPKWGDGSIHYNCRSCHRPCIESERAYDSGNIYHEGCLE